MTQLEIFTHYDSHTLQVKGLLTQNLIQAYGIQHNLSLYTVRVCRVTYTTRIQSCLQQFSLSQPVCSNPDCTFFTHSQGKSNGHHLRRGRWFLSPPPQHSAQEDTRVVAEGSRTLPPRSPNRGRQHSFFPPWLGQCWPNHGREKPHPSTSWHCDINEVVSRGHSFALACLCSS